MTPRKITEAHKAMMELAGIPFPFKTARQLAKLKSRLDEEYLTVYNMDQALVRDMGGEIKANGNYKFQNSEALNEFLKRRDEMMDQEDSITFPVVDLSKYTDMIRISPGALEALEGIVAFGKEDPDGR